MFAHMEKNSTSRISVPVLAGALAALAACSAWSPSPPDTAELGASAARPAIAVDCELPREEALAAVNAARAQARTCGDRRMAAAPPLRWNARLYWAAASHSFDMARNDYLEHRSPAGDSVRERVRAQNYPWRHVGENIAGGSESAERAVQVWLASPAHCENLMEPDYEHMGFACAERSRTEFEFYWTLVMARP